jgi:hypothetical protein
MSSSRLKNNPNRPFWLANLRIYRTGLLVGERRPVFGVWDSGPGPCETCSFPKPLHRRRSLPVKWLRLPKSVLFAKNDVNYFLKTAYCAPFGWIWYESGSEKCANRPFWMADLLPDGLGEVEMEGRAVLGVGSDVSLVGYRR